jgi:glycosyltransferase involved in cell wall biosynthesis
MRSLPFVSCLCVTRNRADLLPRAINCFSSQSYRNKELLVVYEDDDDATKKVLPGLQRENVRFIEVTSSPKMTLGELRNLSISECNGDYFCQWDDDDWYHNKRLAVQMNAILESHKIASVLSFWLIYDSLNHHAYLSHPRLWEGSIMCSKEALGNIRYSIAEKGEDIEFVNALRRANCLHPVIDACMYIYHVNGRNTWDTAHFSGMFSVSQRLSPSIDELLRDIFKGRYSNRKASQLLLDAKVKKELNYWHWESV